MSAESRPCPQCGVTNRAGAKFCGGCGYSLLAAAPTPPAPTSPTAPKRPSFQRTMLGMDMSKLAGAAPEVSPTPAAAPPAESRKAAPARTMLGMSIPRVDPAPPSTPMVAPIPHEPTMQGMPLPAAIAAARTGAPIDPTTNMTMLGTAPPPEVAALAAAVTGAPASVWEQAEPEAAASARAPASRRSVGIVVLVVLVLIAGSVAGGLWWLRRGGAMTATLDTGRATAELELGVAGAAQGAKLRFRGMERPLDSGKARFPVAPESLTVGENRLEAEVVEPGGRTRKLDVVLTLDHRVRVDLGATSARDAAIEVVVEARPGSTAKVDGAPVALDARGVGRHRMVLPTERAEPGARFERAIAYALEVADVGPVRGTVSVSLPRATLLVARPGNEYTTDSAAVRLAGSVTPNAAVWVDGQPARVEGGRWDFLLSVPSVGTVRPTITAAVSQHAPVTASFTVHRVADLAAAASRYGADASLSYATVARDPSALRGRRVAFDTSVYHVDAQTGSGVLQVLARDCPRGERCPLWVVTADAASFGVGDTVRVVGTVGGVQQFRTESARVVSVPRIDAAFVLRSTRGGAR